MMNLSKFRAEKNDFFKNDPHSPLNPDQIARFNGLHYFPENPDLRFEIPIKEFQTQDKIQIQTSTGDVQFYTRLGKIQFKINDVQAELTIFHNQYGLFLPFVDSLAGKETYGAGRYLEPLEQANGLLLVDFNFAYNPYCAYNEQYSCPLTPWENRLNVPIRAGEKIYQSI